MFSHMHHHCSSLTPEWAESRHDSLDPLSAGRFQSNATAPAFVTLTFSHCLQILSPLWKYKTVAPIIYAFKFQNHNLSISQLLFLLRTNHVLRKIRWTSLTGQRSKSFLSEQHKKTSPSNFCNFSSANRHRLIHTLYWPKRAFSKQQTAVAAEVAVVSWCSTLLHFTEKSDRLSCQLSTNNITNHLLSVKSKRTNWLPK